MSLNSVFAKIAQSSISRQLFFLAWFILILLGIYFTIRGFNRNIIPTDITPGVPKSLHIFTGAIALLIGPLQFSNKFRKKWPKYHRTSGYIYIICVLLSVPTAFILAARGFCPECIPAFYIWNTIWFLFTAFALYAAINKQFIAHKHFMIRSYVLMNGFVFTRIDEFLPFPLPEGPEIHRESMIIWLVWVVPLLITEFYLTWLPSLKKQKRSKAS